VLFHVLEGHSNKVIAQHFGMTEAAAKVRLERLLCKIRVDNRTQAAIWALANLPESDIVALSEQHTIAPLVA
jgi:two-component system, NarL family, nitrate/nitrite response regulator NarL